MRRKLQLTAISALSGALLMGAVACDDTHPPEPPPSYDDCAIQSSDQCSYDPDPPDTPLPGPSDSSTNPCAFPGDYLCQDTPLIIPGPNLDTW
ncbi:hypothetical protein [Streptomyces adonidis]|uniref:hypothetical protein n=1 Tax=Streptomyces adonidis TaxID=3231367 RepID=UPI0034DB496F